MGDKAGNRADMVNKARIMLEMQDEMNASVDADWISLDRAWYRAVWIECAELMDHYGGWKWWKREDPDLEQVLLEIVDIWHFGLSMELVACPDIDRAAVLVVDGWNRDLPAAGGFHQEVERLATTALDQRRFVIAAVPRLLGLVERDFDDLFRYYVGKNVLNRFRQDHGYRAGHYRKSWDGREDNEHLSEILADAAPVDDYRAWVYDALARRYATPV